MKLNIACGGHHLSGWINIDLRSDADLTLDVTKGLPYDADSVDYIYSKAFFEHLTVAQGVTHLRDCLRVLKVGGVLRLSTVELEIMLNKYVDGTWSNQRFVSACGAKTRAEAVNWRFYEGYGSGGHRYLYDEEELTRRMKEAGFIKCYRCEFDVSDYPDLCGLESTPGWDDPEMLIMEAIK